jgi:PleD family two-component response regulator
MAHYMGARHTAEAAQNLLYTQSIEMIVLNQDLEAEWGLSLHDLLRTDARTSDIPVILLSQSDGRFSPRLASKDNRMVCFQKPIAIEPFVQHFRYLIKEEAASPISVL